MSKILKIIAIMSFVLPKLSHASTQHISCQLKLNLPPSPLDHQSSMITQESDNNRKEVRKEISSLSFYDEIQSVRLKYKKRVLELLLLCIKDIRSVLNENDNYIKGCFDGVPNFSNILASTSAIVVVNILKNCNNYFSLRKSDSSVYHVSYTGAFDWKLTKASLLSFFNSSNNIKQQDKYKKSSAILLSKAMFRALRSEILANLSIKLDDIATELKNEISAIFNRYNHENEKAIKYIENEFSECLKIYSSIMGSVILQTDEYFGKKVFDSLSQNINNRIVNFIEPQTFVITKAGVFVVSNRRTPGDVVKIYKIKKRCIDKNRDMFVSLFSTVGQKLCDIDNEDNEQLYRAIINFSCGNEDIVLNNLRYLSKYIAEGDILVKSCGAYNDKFGINEASFDTEDVFECSMTDSQDTQHTKIINFFGINNHTRIQEILKYINTKNNSHDQEDKPTHVINCIKELDQNRKPKLKRDLDIKVVDTYSLTEMTKLTISMLINPAVDDKNIYYLLHNGNTFFGKKNHILFAKSVMMAVFFIIDQLDVLDTLNNFVYFPYFDDFIKEKNKTKEEVKNELIKFTKETNITVIDDTMGVFKDFDLAGHHYKKPNRTKKLSTSSYEEMFCELNLQKISSIPREVFTYTKNISILLSIDGLGMNLSLTLIGQHSKINFIEATKIATTILFFSKLFNFNMESVVCDIIKSSLIDMFNTNLCVNAIETVKTNVVKIISKQIKEQGKSKIDHTSEQFLENVMDAMFFLKLATNLLCKYEDVKKEIDTYNQESSNDLSTIERSVKNIATVFYNGFEN